MSCRNAYSGTTDRKTARSVVTPGMSEERFNLYVLSFLLTADRAKAERCYVPGLDLGAEDNATVREWMHSWARKMIVHNAIQLVSPHPDTHIREMRPHGFGAHFRQMRQLLHRELVTLFC